MEKLKKVLDFILIAAMLAVWNLGVYTGARYLRHMDDVPTQLVEVAVLVQPGDSIAGLICDKLEEYPDRRDYREIVHLTMERNNLTSAIIYPGQVLTIPFEVPVNEEK